MRAIVAGLALLLPLASLGGEEAAPRWSVGAGVSFADDGLLLRSNLSSLAPSTTVPFVRASLERRVGAATWLVLGVAGAFETDDAPPAPAYYLASDSGSSWQGRVAAGLRRELTPPAAPFALSAMLLADVGGLSANRKYLAVPTLGSEAVDVREEARGMVAGVSAGAAVERQLTSGLSLRIASTVLSAGWSWTEVKPSNGSARSVRAFRGGLTLAPSLELRLAF